MPDTDAYELDQPIPNLAFGYEHGRELSALAGINSATICMQKIPTSQAPTRTHQLASQYVNTWRITLIDTGDQTMSGGQLKRLSE